MSQSSQDDCGLWMKADLSSAMSDMDNDQQRRDDDVVLGSGERPSTPTVVTHYYDDDDVFMLPPPPLSSSSSSGDTDVLSMPAPPALPSCVTSTLAREEDFAFVPPPPPFPCTTQPLPTDADDVFMPPPSPESCAAFSLQTEDEVEAADPSVAVVAKETQVGLDEQCGEGQLTKVQNEADQEPERAESEDEVDWTPATKDIDILTETCLTSLSLEDSSGTTEVEDLGSRKDECEDMVATNKEQEPNPMWATWDWDCYSGVEEDTPLSQTTSSMDIGPTKGIHGDMLQEKEEIRRKTGKCSEDTNLTECKPEHDESIVTRTSDDSLMEEIVPQDSAREVSDGKANIVSRQLNYDMAEEQWVRPDGNVPAPCSLISRGSSSAEFTCAAATSVLQGEQLLQRLLLVQKKQDEGQGVDTEVAKRAAGDRSVGHCCRDVTTDDKAPGQEGGETNRLENQDGEEAEHKRYESIPPVHQSDNQSDNQSDGRASGDFCPIKIQGIQLPQIHPGSETSTEGGLCQATEGKQDPQRAGLALFEAFLQRDTEGPARHRTRHAAGSMDRMPPSTLTRTRSLEAVSLKNKLFSRSQSFRLQRNEASERERCKTPVGSATRDGTRLSPYPPQQDIPPRFRSVDSLNLSASASNTADAEEVERDMKRALAMLRENPFFKLRPAMDLQPDVERDIRQSREREEELRKQRCTLYGETGRHRSEEEDRPHATSSLRVPDDRLRSKGKLSRVWPPASNTDQLSCGKTQEAKAGRAAGLHKAALWRRWEAGIINGEQGNK